ncbi:hypothetical protein [Alkaliphilus oremlandii]|uniref:Septum formation initiator n=1 Tax=Alkaliphilus oremlandii (strain OhILAs) TaxID=350688 RepID=A8MHY4_ALKOO|nr:hypothetical protein [Alkaliphilus oremlandii]ABW19416.1 hypothetical protein Clos_1876 [Alkaliphilus oremlandii OhILAs]
MGKLLQEFILLLFGYVFVLLLSGGFFIVNNFRNLYREEDCTVISIKEWKEIQVKNSSLKKEREILKIENLKLEKLNHDIAEDLKYYNGQGRDLE